MALIDVPGIHGVIRLFATELLQRTEDKRVFHKQDENEEEKAVCRAYDAIEHRIPPWVRTMIQYASNAAMIRFRLKQLEMKELDASEEHGNEVDACLCSIGFRLDNRKSRPSTLGAGAYGKVYEVDRTSCPGLASTLTEQDREAGNRPKSRRNSPEKEEKVPVAVKVQVIQTKKMLDTWHNELKISRRAGELGVGPRVYDGFLCHRANGKSFGIIIMELVRGVTLLDLFGDRIIDGELSRDERLLFEDIKRRFEQQRKILHDNGIYHGDLHIGNLMVVPKSKPKLKEKRDAGDKAVSREDKARVKVPCREHERIIRPRDIEQVRIFDFGAAQQVIENGEDDKESLKKNNRGRKKKRGADKLAVVGVGAHDKFEWETYESSGLDLHTLEHGMRLMTLFLVEKGYVKL